ncbi:MAG: glycoside hydrolase family 97 N-terminal domain-containing protein, partial [Gammaproteobacteria bacterium]|nr:glycoside hydrolase family 97 N-terminal domain-containing protein [Gammaproteobacteria bacterium]
MNTYSVLVLALGVLLLPAASAESLTSPDGRTRVVIDVSATGSPYYEVFRDDEQLLNRSLLGLLFREHAGLDCCFAISETVADEVEQKWEQPWGERRVVTDRYNELLVNFQASDKPRRRFALRLRAYDDGIGFRYEVPRQRGYRAVDIVEELTQFHLNTGEDSTAWWIPGRRFNRYEYLYSTTAPAAIEMAHTPMTVRYGSGTHISLHEAALVDYAAYVLDQRRPNV